MSAAARHGVADSRSAPGPQLRIAIVVCFRDEGKHLPRLLKSFAAQSLPASEILLIDDGSTDDSLSLARAFAQTTAGVSVLQRQRSAAEADLHVQTGDRLVAAPELQGFAWGVQQLTAEWDVVTKMDGDLELPPTLLDEVSQALLREPQLGVVGSYLSVETDEGIAREHNPAHHVRGPNKFYRRECYTEIAPLPAHLGWDTIDELRARRLGWETHPIAITSGDIIHLRPTGTYDGRMRAYRRWGRCAWGYGAHPLTVCAGAARRSLVRPYGLGGVNYLLGWVSAGLAQAPRVETETRRYCRHEELSRLLDEMRRVLHRRS